MADGRWLHEDLERGSSSAPRLGPVSFQPRSSNDKLSHVRRRRHRNGRYQTFPQAPFVCSTYVSIHATCPPSCRFRDNGCYAQSGQAAAAMKRLDTESKRHGLTGLEVNRLEAELIDRMWNNQHPRRVPQDGKRGGRDLRLHVGGDTSCDDGAYWLGRAAERWRARGGGDVWTYTANWRVIKPESFGSISTFASVQTPDEALEAIDLGWTPAWTMTVFPQSKRFVERESGVRVIPCPAQTCGVKCIDCRLCFLPRIKGTAIGFELHGMGRHKAARRLPVLGQRSLDFGS